MSRENAADCDGSETFLRSTKIRMKLWFSAVSPCKKRVSKCAPCGTQIFTFSRHEIPADFRDEAVTDVRGFEMRELLTSCSHRIRFRPQVRSESENHALRCQDFSTNAPNIFPQNFLAVTWSVEIHRVAARS